MHQYFAQQSAGQAPQITCPDPFDRTAIHELAKDGVDAVAHPTQSSAPAWIGVAFRVAIGRQQLDVLALPVGGGPGRPGVAVAHQDAGGLLGQGGTTASSWTLAGATQKRVITLGHASHSSRTCTRKP